MLPDISSFELLLILATISHLCTVYHLKQVCCLCFLFAKTGKPVEPLSLCPCYLACASARPGGLGELLTHASRQPSTNGGVGNENHLINATVSILPKVGMRFFYLSQRYWWNQAPNWCLQHQCTQSTLLLVFPPFLHSSLYSLTPASWYHLPNIYLYSSPCLRLHFQWNSI